MKFRFILAIFIGVILSSCAGVSSKGIFGTGVSIAFDPRTVGTQMDDSIMQKNLAAKIIVKELQKLGVNVFLYDPFFNSMIIYGLETQNNLEKILPEMDGAIIVTGHDDFKNIPVSSFSKMKNPILVDTRGIINPVMAKKEKIIFRGLGRGGF